MGADVLHEIFVLKQTVVLLLRFGATPPCGNTRTDVQNAAKLHFVHRFMVTPLPDILRTKTTITKKQS
jgi:hypothetical protein